MSFSDSDTSSHGGEYKNFRQISRERKNSILSLSLSHNYLIFASKLNMHTEDCCLCFVDHLWIVIFVYLYFQ